MPFVNCCCTVLFCLKFYVNKYYCLFHYKMHIFEYNSGVIVVVVEDEKAMMMSVCRCVLFCLVHRFSLSFQYEKKINKWKTKKIKAYLTKIYQQNWSNLINCIMIPCTTISTALPYQQRVALAQCENNFVNKNVVFVACKCSNWNELNNAIAKMDTLN